MMKPCSLINLCGDCSLSLHALLVCIIQKGSRNRCLWQKLRSWLSRHHGAQQVEDKVLVGPLTIKIGGEANGEDHEDVVDVVVLVEDAEVETVVEVEEAEGVILERTIPLHAITVGCVAVWPTTVPSLLSHREVAILALPKGDFLNPGKEAQDREDEVVQCASVH